jgi:hypothetical protein
MEGAILCPIPSAMLSVSGACCSRHGKVRVSTSEGRPGAGSVGVLEQHGEWHFPSRTLTSWCLFRSAALALASGCLWRLSSVIVVHSVLPPRSQPLFSFLVTLP